MRQLLLSTLFFIWCIPVTATDTRPNVILIICDDLNDSVEGMGGHSQAHTPNIERLMHKGVRFTNAHCNAPICGPSRASLWSGLLPSTSGYYGYAQQQNDWRKFDKLTDAVTLMEHFKSNGYNVWGSGKIFHNGHSDNSVFTISPDDDLDRPGASDFGPFPWDGFSFHGTSTRRVGQSHPRMPSELSGYWTSFGSLEDVPTVGNYTGWSLKEVDFTYNSPVSRDLMPDEVTARWVAAKLSQTHSKPFLLTVGMNRPHIPFYAPDEFFELYRDEEGNNIVELPPYLENDLDDVPAILKEYSDGIANYRTAGAGNDQWWKNLVQAYLACVSFVDHQVGTILDAVEASEYADNTIIIFTSDHGYHLGEKNHRSKTTAWEETTRVPLVFYVPELTPSNQVCSAPVSLVDLYPTLNSLCGLPADPNGGSSKNNIALDGHDLTPFLRQPDIGRWDGPLVSLSHLNSQEAIAPHVESPWALNHHSVRSADYHYVLCSDGSEELYDHSDDPNEWVNRALDPVYAEIKSGMKLQLFHALGFKNATSNVTNGSFENNFEGWNNFGPVHLEINTVNTLAGDHSVLVSDRTAQWNGLKQNMLSQLERGKTFHISAWVKLVNSDSDVIRLNIKQVIGSNDPEYLPIDSINATNERFALIEGKYTVPESDEITAIELTVNGPAAGVDFIVDYVRVYEYQTPVMIASILVDNSDGSISIRWNAELGLSYRLERSLNLISGWEVVESSLVADRTNMLWNSRETSLSGRGFWRVVKNP
ncbi:MAG: sulfatase-like hydrolase/transferase [Lentimonas sp.]